MDQAQTPKKDITLLLNDSPGHREIAVAVQSYWKELGINTTIKQQEWAQFLEFIGPPPDKSVDVYRYGWIGDFVDAINFLELWTCDSGNNSTNYCDPEYDKLVERGTGHARQRGAVRRSTPRWSRSSSATRARFRCRPSTGTPTSRAKIRR